MQSEKERCLMDLNGTRAVVLVEELYEETEAWCPIYRLREAGVAVVIAGTGAASYKGLHGYPIQTDAKAEDLNADDFDLVVVPGGYAPDVLRSDPGVQSLVRDANARDKVIAAMCHGPWVLISSGLVQGRTLTSLFRIRDDVENAGARWVDEEVVIDGNLITSRSPADIPAFCSAIIHLLDQRSGASRPAAAAAVPAI
jgi:protease I